MNPDSNRFEIICREEKLIVQRHPIGSETIFRITFSDSRPALVITLAAQENTYRFWTSIPEGRQREAEEIGTLLEEFYKKIEQCAITTDKK